METRLTPRKRKRWANRQKYKRNPDDIVIIDSDGETKVIARKAPQEDPPENTIIIETIDLPWDLSDAPVIHDAIEIMPNTVIDKIFLDLTKLPRTMFDFDWKPLSPSVQTKREAFKGPFPGPKNSPTTPYDIFVEIWDESIMQRIVEQTNIYARQSTANDWNDTNVDELYVYFSMLISFSLCIKTNIKEYFYPFSDLIDTPNFQNYMTYERFVSLNNYLHFANNLDLDTNSPHKAKCFKIEYVIKHLNKKFQDLYNLDRNIAIVESLLKARGLPDIIDSINKETDAEALKVFELCDMNSGYMWRVEIYSGEEHQIVTQTETSPTLGPELNFVLRFMDGLQNRGHTLYMDSFFNSPALARVLKASGTDCVGTMRTNRPFVPKEIEAYQKKVQQTVVADQTSGDVNIILWRERNRIALVSTYHSNAIISGQNPKGGTQKLAVVQDYLKHIGALDKRDQVIAGFRIEQGKSSIWYKKVFRHLFAVSLFNGWIIHNSALEKKVTHRVFRYELVNEILSKHFIPCVDAFEPTLGEDTSPVVEDTSTVVEDTSPVGEDTSPVGRPVFTKEALEHFPRDNRISPLFLPGGEECISGPCVMCGEVEVHTYCSGCQVTLCAFTCHITYHSGIKNESS